MVEELPSEDFEDDNEIIGETSHYSKKAGFDKGGIVQRQVERCLLCRAKDLTRPGYINWIKDKHGNIKPQEIPDYRKEFIGAIEGLKSILLPEIKKDKEAKETLDEFEEEAERIFFKYAYQERLHKEIIKSPDGNPYHNKSKWVYSGNIFMPELGAVILSDDPKSPNSLFCCWLPNIWDSKHNAYYQEMVKLCDLLFGELNILIDKNNYFKAGSGW